MDLVLSEEQGLLVEAVRRVVDHHGGSERAVLAARSGADDELLSELAQLEFLDLATDTAAGPLEAALVVETVTAGLGTCPVGAVGFVGPLCGAFDGAGSRPQILATQRQLDAGVPVRFGSMKVKMLVLGEAGVNICSVEAAEPIVRSWGYPLARVRAGASTAIDVDARLMAASWRVSVSTEIVACASRAFSMTLAYLKEREQFGRSLGTFQALQHRMSQLLVAVEGARWLTYEAAWRGADTAASILCAAEAVRAGRLTIRECHQLSGAQGLTVESELHHWTMRLSDLCSEIGGPGFLLTANGPSWSDFEFTQR